mgnify:CR=1 FL=1
MDNVLFIFNMQEIYAGPNRNKEKYSYNAEDLIKNINKRSLEYQPEEVFYIKSVAKGLGALVGSMPKADSRDSDFVRDLKIRSRNIYEKNKSDCFSNDALADFMRARNVKVIEFVGIDTSDEIGRSALTATEDLDLKVVYNELLMVNMAPDKAGKYRDKIRKTRITFKHDWEE